MGRPAPLLVKAGEIPRHRASSASTPLYLALTPTANPPVEPLPAPFALVCWPALDEMWAWTARALPELGDCPPPLLPPYPPALPSCIKYLAEGGQRQKRGKWKGSPMHYQSGHITVLKDYNDNTIRTCSTGLRVCSSPSSPGCNGTISRDNTAASIGWHHCCSTSVHALLERCCRPI